MTELFEITLKNSTILRYTNFQTSLTVQGVLYLSGSPNFERGAIRETIGFEVPTMEFTVIAGASDLIGSTPMLQTIQRGDWDGAIVKVYRLYMASNLAQIGMFVRFLGQLGDLDSCGRTMAKFTAKGMTEQLNMKLPRNLIQPGCVHTLFDSGCTLNKEDFGETVALLSGSNRSVLLFNSAKPTAYYDLGTLTFLNGTNHQLSASVKTYIVGSPSVAHVARPLLFDPSGGDSVRFYPGCDKTLATCRDKFSNLPNALLFPFVPAPETSL